MRANRASRRSPQSIGLRVDCASQIAHHHRTHNRIGKWFFNEWECTQAHVHTHIRTYPRMFIQKSTHFSNYDAPHTRFSRIHNTHTNTYTRARARPKPCNYIQCIFYLYIVRRKRKLSLHVYFTSNVCVRGMCAQTCSRGWRATVKRRRRVNIIIIRQQWDSRSSSSSNRISVLGKFSHSTQSNSNERELF